MTDTRARVITGALHTQCRYGENAHQAPAMLYKDLRTSDPLALHRFEHIDGPAPSYNTYCDLDRLLQTLTHAAAALKKNARGVSWRIALAAKHGNCCGASYGQEVSAVIERTVLGDKRAIFGGVVLANFPIGTREAETLLGHGMEAGKRFLTCVIAPRFHEEAVPLLLGARKRCTLLENSSLAEYESLTLDAAPRFRYVRGGFLAQPNYTYVPQLVSAMCAGKLPDEVLLADIAFSWAIGATSNSNTISIVHRQMLVGNGVGQQDRVGAAELALKRARDAGHTELEGAVAYSDSFFPFPDGPETLIKAGVRTIFATSGSVQDANVQKACEALGGTLLLMPDSEARGFFGH